MRCPECGRFSPAGVCVGPHAGIEAERYVERRHLVFESWPPRARANVEQVDDGDGVMTVVRGADMEWRIHGDMEWMLRRVAAGSKASGAQGHGELRRAVDRIVSLAGLYGLEVTLRRAEPEVVAR